MSQTRTGTENEIVAGICSPLWERRLNSQRKQLNILYELMSKQKIVQQGKKEDIFAHIPIDSVSSEVGDYLTFSTAPTPAERIAVEESKDVTAFMSNNSTDDANPQSNSLDSGLFSVGLLMADAHPHTTQTQLQEDQEPIRKDEKGKQRSTEGTYREGCQHDSGASKDHNSFNDDPAEENNISAKYACPHPGCEKVFTRQFHVRRHILTHDNKKPFNCPHKGCQARFTRMDNCTQHQRTKHGFRM